ncbi:MAG TPA: magnesium/cobalt transporter CorA [Actinomycetota bacterium]|nr:magnesium/cobalt transporter CorA [Actinomycetota bacterium]
MTVQVYRKGRCEEADFDPSRIDEALAESDSLVWVDISDPSKQEIELLGREFGFHPLALEDALHPHQRAKIDQYETYFFVVAYGVSPQDSGLVEHEMGIFVGENYLVTVRKAPPFDMTAAVKRWEAHAELAREGGGYFLYILLDEIVDGYFAVLERYEDRAEEVEDQVFGGQFGEETQSSIFSLKKDLQQFRRRAAPLREVLDVMQRRLVPVVTERLEPYYRDVYDHVLRATDFVDSLRELLSSALEASLAVVSNRLNEVMKQLTSWAAIILVPTLVAGIYGMNFRHMPELNWLLGYPFALALMLLSGGALHVIFKRRHWL